MDEEDDDEDGKVGVPMYKVVLLVASFAILSAALAVMFAQGKTMIELKEFVENIPKVCFGPFLDVLMCVFVSRADTRIL